MKLNERTAYLNINKPEDQTKMRYMKGGRGEERGRGERVREERDREREKTSLLL